MRPLTEEEMAKVQNINDILNSPEKPVKRKMRNRIEYVCPRCKTILYEKYIERCDCGKFLKWW